MAGKKSFVNPLTRSSESELNLPAQQIGMDGAIGESTEADGRQKRAKGRDRIFEETHQRFTGWVDRELKRKFDTLAAQKRVSKSALLDEAIAVLLHKQQRKPYTRQANMDDE